MKKVLALSLIIGFFVALALWGTSPCPAGAEGGKSVRDLGIIVVGTQKEDVPFLNQVLREDDIVFVYGPKRWLHRVRIRAKLAVSRQSIADLKDALAKLRGVPIAYVNYNPEQWKSSHTPCEELDHLVEAVQAVRRLADQRGAKLSFGTDYVLLEQYGKRIAPLVDFFGIQLQRFQREPREAFRRAAERLVAIVKRGNPKVPIAFQLSLAPPQFEERVIRGVRRRVVVRDEKGRKLLTPVRAEVLERIEAIKDLADYIAFIYTEESRGELRRLLRMLRPAEG